MVFRPLFVVLLLVLAACMPEPRSDEVRLSRAEVLQIFIGNPWHNPYGAFIFRANGSGAYKNFGDSKPLSEFDYRLESDGSIIANGITFVFYQNPNGFRYFHSKSNKFYSAKPNQVF